LEFDADDGNYNIRKERMKKAIFLLVSTGLFFALGAQEMITVYRNGNEFFVRSGFSAKYDIVIRNWLVANEAAYLLEPEKPITDALKGKLLHISSDDYPATSPLGAFGVLSGNHGSPFARTLSLPEHGFTTADLGGKVNESDGYAYYIMQIVDKNHVLIHPEGNHNTEKPGFRGHSTAPLFYKEQELKFTESKFTQMHPLNRITDFRILTDGGNEVPDKTEIKCHYLDFIFVHDVVSPLAAVQWMKENPGRKPSPEWKDTGMMFVNSKELRETHADYMKLDALATYHNRFRFEARGACVNYRKAVYLSALSSVSSLDVMFGWNGDIAGKDKEEFYIPKLKPVKVAGYQNGNELLCDFSAIFRMPNPMQVNSQITAKDCLDPSDPPDRFIRVVGNEKREYGIALGYSLFLGCTARPRNISEQDSLFHLWHTKKMYPYAYTLKNVKPGKTMETVAYKQYFDPQAEPDATAYYWHHQGDSLIVYLDFHQPLAPKIFQLPTESTGKKISILEKTPSVTLRSGNFVSGEGTVTLEVNGNYGYLVMKL